MNNYQSLKEHYKFTKEEEEILKTLQPRMNAFTFVRTFVLKSIEENFENKAQHIKEIRAV